MCYKKHRLPAALVTPTGLLSHVHNDRWHISLPVCAS